jgi:hypothetical protein
MALSPEELAAITAFRLETEDMIKAVVLQYYFNTGVPYTNEAQVLSVIDTHWSAYLTVNVAGVEFWYLPNGTLVNKTGSLALLDKAVTLEKMADMATASLVGRNTAGTGIPQVLSIATVKTMLGIVDGSVITLVLADKVDKVAEKSLVLNTEVAKIHSPFAVDEVAAMNLKVDKVDGSSLIANSEKTRLETIKQNVYTIKLPASGTVAGRCAGVIELPAGWTIAPGTSAVDLLITHSLGREIAVVTVWKIDTDGKRLLYGNTAFSGIIAPGNTTLLIESLATINLPINIELTFGL